MQIKFSDIKSARSQDELDSIISEIVSTNTKESPIYLSDIIVNYNNGGGLIMKAIADRDEEDAEGGSEERILYKIKVVRDEWGNPPVPGEKVKWVINKRPKDQHGRPVTASDAAAMRITGDWDKKFKIVREYTVDNKGCISVPFQVAAAMLNVYGLHGRTMKPITKNHPIEHSTEPVETPSGEKLHVWYWRYYEVTPEEHVALPDLEKVEAPKRGYTKRKKD